MSDANKAEAMLMDLLHLPQIADWGGVMIPRELGDAALQEHGVIPESVKDALEQGMSPGAIKALMLERGFLPRLVKGNQGGVG